MADLTMAVPDKCTRQSVQIAVKRRKFPSNPQKGDLFTAGTVIRSIASSKR